MSCKPSGIYWISASSCVSFLSWSLQSVLLHHNNDSLCVSVCVKRYLGTILGSSVISTTVLADSQLVSAAVHFQLQHRVKVNKNFLNSYFFVWGDKRLRFNRYNIPLPEFADHCVWPSVCFLGLQSEVSNNEKKRVVVVCATTHNTKTGKYLTSRHVSLHFCVLQVLKRAAAGTPEAVRWCPNSLDTLCATAITPPILRCCSRCMKSR